MFVRPSIHPSIRTSSPAPESRARQIKKTSPRREGRRAERKEGRQVGGWLHGARPATAGAYPTLWAPSHLPVDAQQHHSSRVNTSSLSKHIPRLPEREKKERKNREREKTRGQLPKQERNKEREGTTERREERL